MRPAAVGLLLGLAVAIGIPAAWALTRPPAAAGPPVEQVLGSSTPDTRTAEADRPVTRPAAPPAAPALPPPVRLEVPAHGVDSAVDPVGVEPDGQMTIPADVARVGWYRFGPVPGAPGSAVIAGHVDDRSQGLGALAPLRAAAPGDEVLVTDAAGATSRWRVVSRELITKQALPLDELFRRDGPPRLTLITCGGPFLPEYGSYRDNVVVVAEPIP
jgi:hypothetical protein